MARFESITTIISDIEREPQTFTYPIVPTRVDKSRVVMSFCINNHNTVARPCSQNHCGVDQYITRGGDIEDECGDASWLLAYPIFAALAAKTIAAKK